MAAVRSVDPSLTITHRFGSTVWDITDRMVSPMKSSSFRAGVINT
jgi:hypothetical protein